MQYFYIVGYTLIGNDLTLCKVSLNEHALMSWARREATKHDALYITSQYATRDFGLKYRELYKIIVDGAKTEKR